MWVVKIGGSLARDPRLSDWLQMLATLGGGRVTVVPGGGGFADGARQSQAQWGYGDVAAHNMAVLAMAQTAYMMGAIEPRLPLVQHDAEIREALHGGRPALWLPLPLLREQADELTTWDVSSDSLALWLARRLNAERLIVVKACTVEPEADLGQLSSRGVLDRRFPDWARDAAFPIEVLPVTAIDRVRERLVGGEAVCSAAWTALKDGAADAPATPRRRRVARRRASDQDELGAEVQRALGQPRH